MYFRFVAIILHLLLVTQIHDCSTEKHERLKRLVKSNRYGTKDPTTMVRDLIRRVIGDAHDINDFIIKFPEDMNNSGADAFELEMDEANEKLVITANSILAATWGFNHYLKYYTNSSVFWSGKNIRLNSSGLPKVPTKIKIEKYDYFKFYQNICTYSYSYVWWDWDRWQYEIDWMALNGINIAYAHTAAEYVWSLVFKDFKLSETEINDFFTGPAYLAWFRMGNIKRYGGGLTPAWHSDQVELQKKILKRYSELGIAYVLPAFSGFVPDAFRRLYPEKTFIVSNGWCEFSCNYSCLLLIDPEDSLFQQVGAAYLQKSTELFGTSHFYSADVFNEMNPITTDLNYLAKVNEAIYNSMKSVDPTATWIMQAWLFLNPFWTFERVQAFLSLVPVGNLILLDLATESSPQYQKYSSYFGHAWIWNMLHNFGGSNHIHGQLNSINYGPDRARNFINSTMIGTGITMEGIDQNEFIYEFMLEKSWMRPLDDTEIQYWINNFTYRRYTNFPSDFSSGSGAQIAWLLLAKYNYNSQLDRQLFTRRPSLNLNPENDVNLEMFYVEVRYMLSEMDNYRESDLFKYDLVDLTKELLRKLFSRSYKHLVDAYNQKDLYAFSETSSLMTEILTDMDSLLATDRRFLLGNWLEAAKSKATTADEKKNYEWNSRAQITLWGQNSTNILFDYACKSWSGLVNDYYLKRWIQFFKIAEKSILEGSPIDQKKLNEKLLINIELPFISSNSVYPVTTKGDSLEIAEKIFNKYLYSYR